jgi:hypothetical protein
MKDEDKEQTDQKSFMQEREVLQMWQEGPLLCKNVTCYKCGKKGHYYANKCPDGDNDEEASTRSCPSNNSRPNRVG